MSCAFTRSLFIKEKTPTDLKNTPVFCFLSIIKLPFDTVKQFKENKNCVSASVAVLRGEQRGAFTRLTRLSLSAHDVANKHTHTLEWIKGGCQAEKVA